MIDWEEQLDATLHLGVEHISNLWPDLRGRNCCHRNEGKIQETEDITAIACLIIFGKK